MNNDVEIARELQTLLQDKEDRLFARLGSSLHSIEMNPAAAGTYKVPDIPMGFGSDLIDLGKKLYQRWNKEAYGFVCGGGEGAEAERQNFWTPLGLGSRRWGPRSPGC